MLDAEMLEESYLYKRMYLYLFNRITDALEYKTIEEIKESLMKAQCETEDIYIEKKAEIPEIEILRTINENETNIGLLELLIETEKEDLMSLFTDDKITGLDSKNQLVKILGNGALTKAIEVEANAFSKKAEEAIVAAGGTVTKK